MSSQSNAVTRKMQQGDNILNKYWNAFSKDASDQLGATEAAIYTVGALVIVVGYHIASDGIFSSIVTLASVIQFLGLVLTLVKVSKNGFGVVSITSLRMYIPVYILRLMCTLFNEGYLPVDTSGDWAYQTADVASLAVVIFLIWKADNDFNVIQEDYFPSFWCTVGCVLFATVCHPCHNMGQWSDVWWTASIFLETFVMLPQLRLMAVRKSVEGVTSHAIACTGVNRLFNFYFWYVCREELVHGCPSTIPMYFVVGALAMQTLLLCDFMLFYLKVVVHRASNGYIQLPQFCSDDGMISMDV